MPITFVAAVNNEEILENNFMASPCLRTGRDHQILLQRGFSSASRAYNDAIDRSANDLIVFAHQDVVFPRSWFPDLDRALSSLEEKGDSPKWGVLGCYGVNLDRSGHGHVYSPGRVILGRAFEAPVPVQTLDEIVLIVRKSSGLRFDEKLPHFHFYGTDICMAAAARGLTSYAISALCIHNYQEQLVLPKEFYLGYQYIRRKWSNSLPIQTACIRITRFKFEMYKRILRETYLQNIRRKEVVVNRVRDGQGLLAEFERLHPETMLVNAGNGR